LIAKVNNIEEGIGDLKADKWHRLTANYCKKCDYNKKLHYMVLNITDINQIIRSSFWGGKIYEESS
jgi:hypothetical protein